MASFVGWSLGHFWNCSKEFPVSLSGTKL